MDETIYERSVSPPIFVLSLEKFQELISNKPIDSNTQKEIIQKFMEHKKNIIERKTKYEKDTVLAKSNTDKYLF